MSERPLPSPEAERANAAYVWVKACQEELAIALRGENAGFLTGWQEIQWRYRRLEQAVSMMVEAEAARNPNTEASC